MITRDEEVARWVTDLVADSFEIDPEDVNPDMPLCGLDGAEVLAEIDCRLADKRLPRLPDEIRTVGQLIVEIHHALAA